MGRISAHLLERLRGRHGRVQVGVGAQPARAQEVARRESSLTSCVKGTVPTGGEVVSVRGQFSTGPALRVEQLDSAGTDVTCLKTVVEEWKNDGFQPSAGPVRFEVRFRSN